MFKLNIKLAGTLLALLQTIREIKRKKTCNVLLYSKLRINFLIFDLHRVDLEYKKMIFNNNYLKRN